MIVQKLRPWVTSFSEAISSGFKHGEEVCIGGEITHIFNMAELMPEDQQENEGVYLTLDDGVGVNNVFIPYKAYQFYHEKYGLQLGTIVLAEGRVFHMKMEQKKKVLKHHPEATTRILCWKVMPLPDKEPAVES